MLLTIMNNSNAIYRQDPKAFWHPSILMHEVRLLPHRPFLPQHSPKEELLQV